MSVIHLTLDSEFQRRLSIVQVYFDFHMKLKNDEGALEFCRAWKLSLHKKAPMSQNKQSTGMLSCITMGFR